MAADAYAGQGNGRSTPTAVRENDANVAPADRSDYNPANFTGQPGAAARRLGYPRSDGK